MEINTPSEDTAPLAVQALYKWWELVRHQCKNGRTQEIETQDQREWKGREGSGKRGLEQTRREKEKSQEETVGRQMRQSRGRYRRRSLHDDGPLAGTLGDQSTAVLWSRGPPRLDLAANDHELRVAGGQGGRSRGGGRFLIGWVKNCSEVRHSNRGSSAYLAEGGGGAEVLGPRLPRDKGQDDPYQRSVTGHGDAGENRRRRMIARRHDCRPTLAAPPACQRLRRRSSFHRRSPEKGEEGLFSTQ